MAEQQLDGTHVGAGFKEMDGKGVTKQMRSNRFGNAAASMGLLTGLFHRILADGLPWPITGE